MRSVEPPQPGDFVMYAVIPILCQVISDAENEYAPQERNPVKEIVLVRKHSGKNRKAEPRKEGRESQFRDGEARQVQRSFIPVPLSAVQAK